MQVQHVFMRRAQSWQNNIARSLETIRINYQWLSEREVTAASWEDAEDEPSPTGLEVR